LNKKIKTGLQIFIFTGLGIFLVWLSIKNVSIKDIQSAFARTNGFYIALCFITGILSHVSRAMRWQLALEPLGYKPGFLNSFSAVMIGYVVNYAIPRLGEVTRCTVLSRYSNIPFEKNLGTVLTERIIDVLTMTLVLTLTLIFQFDSFYEISKEFVLIPISNKFSPLLKHTSFVVIFTLVLLSSIIILFLKRKMLMQQLKGRLGKFVKGFSDGLQSVTKVRSPLQYLFHSVFIWAMYYVGIYVCFFCLTETATLGWKEALSILLVGTIGVIFTPGGLGAYHAMVGQVLLYYGMSKVIAVAFPWIVWGTGFVVILLFGLIGFILLPLINKNKSII
jgi:hypothetical protein